MKNRILIVLLAIVMLVSMIPTVAMAAEEPRVYVDTTGVGELEAGDTFSVPIAIENNPGICIAWLSIGIPDAFTYVSITNDSGAASLGWNEGTAAWEFDTDYASNYTNDGTLFTLNLKVNEDATGGNHEITLELLNNDPNNFGDDVGNISATFESGTVSVKADITGAKFVNGSQTLSFAEAKAEAEGAEGAETLSSPGADYYFAGWFSGLDETYKDATTGYYVINASAGAVGGTTFNGTELRPRYDADPEGGTYNALWIKDDPKAGGNYASMVMSVQDNTFTLYMITSSGLDLSTNTGYQGNDNTVFTNAATADGRIKLIRDLYFKTTFTYKQDTHGELELDLNGRTISFTGSKYLNIANSTSTVLESPRIESSHGQGKFVAGTSYCVYVNYVNNMIIRDVDMVAASKSPLYLNKGVTGITIEHCYLECQATPDKDDQAALYFYGYNAPISGVKINNSTLKSGTGIALYVEYGSAEITNTTITSDVRNNSIDALIYFENESPNYMITFGEGNNMSSTAVTNLFSGEEGGYVHFTSTDGTYKVADGNQVIDSIIKVTTGAAAAGKVPFTENGELKFYDGYSIDYYSYTGYDLLYTEYVKAGSHPTGFDPVTGEPFAVEMDRTNLEADVHAGWYKASYNRADGDEAITPVDLSAITQENYLDYTADGKLYSVRKTETLDPKLLVSYTWGTTAAGLTTYTDVPYYDLSEAMDAMKVGYSSSATNLHNVNIKLVDDIETSDYVSLGSYFNTDLTLDLNGHTWTANDMLFYVSYGSSNRTHTVNVISTGDRGTIQLAGATDTLTELESYTGGTNLYYSFSNLRIVDTVSNGGYLLYVEERSNTSNTAIVNVTFNDVQIETAANAVYYKLGTNGANTINVDFANSNLKFGGTSVLTFNNASYVGSSVLSLNVDALSKVHNADGSDPVGSTMTSYVTVLKDSDTDGWWTAEVGTCTDGHTPGEATVETVEEKTCTVTGQYDTVVTCTTCNVTLSRVTSYTMAGHVYQDPVQENFVDPTCTATGSYNIVIYCADCDEKGSTKVTVPATGHTWKGGTETTSHTCSVCGALEVARVTKTVTNVTAANYGEKTVTSYATFEEAEDSLSFTYGYEVHNELDILQDVTASRGLVADDVWIGLIYLTVDLNGNTMTFASIAEGSSCFAMSSVRWDGCDFIIQSTGAQGTIVIPSGAYGFIGGHNPLCDGLTIQISDVKFEASNLTGGCLIEADPAEGKSVTVTLENVEFSGDAATVAVGGIGTTTLNLTDCKLTNTAGSVVAVNSDITYADGVAQVNLSGENLALTTSSGVAPIDAVITGYEDVTVTSPEGYALADPDGDNTYKLVPACVVNNNHTDLNEKGVCNLCGKVTKTCLDNYTLSLDGTIAVNFYVLVTDEVQNDPNAYMEITVANTTVKLSLDEATAHDGDKFKFTVRVAAKQMTDDISAKFCWGESNATDSYSTSIKKYGEYQMANTTDDNLIALIKAMLHYGAYAQTQFNYNTDNLANADLDPVDMSNISAETLKEYAFNGETGTEKANLVSSSLILESGTTFRLFFEVAEGATLSVKYNNEDLPVKTRGGYSYVDVPNIVAKKLSTPVSVIVCDGEQEQAVICNPMVYAYSVLYNSANPESVSNLVKALYLYNQAAVTYFSVG